jgi:hypothetical protein
MGSVSAANTGVTDLLQMLSNLNSPVLSSPAVTSALKKASSSDIVQLSMAANQLEGVDEMFGISNSSNASTNTTFANLENLLTGSTGTSSNAQVLSAATSNAATAVELANEQTAALSAQTSALLYGTGITGSASGSLFNLMG